MSEIGLSISQVQSKGFDVKTTELSSDNSLVLNSVMDVDKYGNKNGKVEVSDFFQIYRKYKNEKGLLKKLYTLYILEQGKHTKIKGNYKITEIDIPFTSEKVKIVVDKTTGRIVMESTTSTSEAKGVETVNVEKKYYGVENVKSVTSSFQYDIEAIENYIINKAVDGHGNKIKKFSTIPDIRKTPEAKRTAEEKNLLKEFENLINYSIDAGVDYGIDPKLVLSIIQQEVGFDGLSPRVVGANGKGYMQLTSAPVQDFLGYNGKTYGATKVSQYGPEMEELLFSRGFNVHSAKTPAEKEQLYKKIMNYLKENKDPEFNIRLGTLVLVNKMKKANGNVATAAKNYNGHPKYKIKYSQNVLRYHNILESTVPRDSSFNVKILNA